MNGVILLIVMLLFSAAVLALMFGEQRKSTKSLIENVAKSVAEDLNSQLNLINQLNKAVFLSYEMQDIFEEYRDALYADSDADASDIALRATNFIDNYVQLDQSLIKEVAYIPKTESGAYDIYHTLYYGLNVDTVSQNLALVVNTAQKEEYARGGLFVVDFLYQDLTSSNFYAFGRNVLELRPYSSEYMQNTGIGVVAINKSSLLNTLNRKDALKGLEVCVLYKDKVFLETENGFSAEKLQEKNYFVSEKYLTGFDASVIAYYGYDAYFAGILRSTAGTALIVLTVCVAIMLFFIFANRRTSKALRFLFDEFSEIKTKNKVRHIEYTKNREVDNVIENFNLMADSLTELNTEVLEEKNKSLQLQVENIEFELSSLYAQINKHFLINVLSAVRALVNAGEAEKAKSCLENLSEFLRYSLSEDKSSTVAREMESLACYMNIQKIRFPKIEYEAVCEAGAGDFPLQKMILQPVIENCFVHSIKNKRGKIRVVCRMRPDGVGIFVIDNGEGMTKEREHRVNEDLRGNFEKAKKKEKGNRIALVNIQKRIKLTAGEKSFVRLKALNGGAMTYIRLVWRKGEDKDV